MAEFPVELVSTDEEKIASSDGSEVHVKKAMPELVRWEGKPLTNTFGECVFAELAILRLLEREGWCGRWVETYGAPNSYPRFMQEWSDTRLTGLTFTQPTLSQCRSLAIE